MTRFPALDDLSLDERIGQLFVPEAYGAYMNETAPAYRRLEHFVRDRSVGGIIWFLSSVYETALLNARLQRLARVPLLISADLEAGMGMRFLDTTFWPSAMAIAATGDPSLAERQGKAVAIEARTVGVNHILAPVADVNVDPDNPVINTRSFGEDPETVASFVAAFIRGVQSERVLATAKHFPGHGDTHVDSHRSLPVLDVTAERLATTELVPFRAAIAAGVQSVMIGHLSVPSVDPRPAPLRTDGVRENRYVEGAAEAPRHATLPATLSHPIVTGILRERLGFRGLVVTDAMDMGGLTEHFDAAEAAVRAIEAGEDQIVFSANTDAAIDAVKAAVASGRLTRERIDESVRRILTAKALVSHEVGDPDEIFRLVDSQSTRELAAEIAEKAITLVREESGTLPLKKSARVALLVVTDLAEAANPVAGLESALKERLTAPPRMFQIDARSTSEEVAPAALACRDSDVVIVALAVRARSGAGRLAVPRAAKHVLEQVRGCQARMIALSFGSPYVIRELPQVATYLCAYGPSPVLSIAAARALFGEAPIGGRLPVTIPGMYARGHGILCT
jgi:beta-glucosidase-like glycosyl hydrolase